MTLIIDEPMADVRGMYMTYTALRREFRLLPQLIRDVAPGDTERAEIVGAHAELVCRILHAHLGSEDALLWPKLLARGGDEAVAVVSTMEEQHQAIDRAYLRPARLLPNWRSAGQGGEELADAFELLLAVVIAHMATEEKLVLPLAEKHVTAVEWRALGEHGMAGIPKKELDLTSDVRIL
ncbi:hemerythrin domain-containing protein [Streptomyces sp. NPDC004059]